MRGNGQLAALPSQHGELSRRQRPEKPPLKVSWTRIADSPLPYKYVLAGNTSPSTTGDGEDDGRVPPR